jgi:hypothetical protein
MLEVKWAHSGQSFIDLITPFIVNIARLEEQDTMRVFRILFDYIQAYPRHAYKYLVKRQFCFIIIIIIIITIIIHNAKTLFTID